MENVRSTPYIHTLDKPIEPNELQKCITALKNGRACDLDLILNEMIKVAVPYIEKSLIKLLDNCLESSVYPTMWCKGYMSPIYKCSAKARCL